MYKRFLIFALVLGITGAAYGDITTGLVAHYQFEDNVSDSTANSYDGTVSASGVSYGTPLLSYGTMSGKMVRLDGSSGYVDLPAAVVNQNSSAITIAFWAKSGLSYPGTGLTQPSIQGTGANSAVLRAAEPYWSAPHFWKRTVMWYAYDDGTNKGPGSMAGGYYYYCCKTGSARDMRALYGGYMHWTYTFDLASGDGELYMNGYNKAGYGGKTIGLPAMSAVRLGAKLDLSAYRNGAIDDLRIYSRALGTGDIAELIPEPATIALLGLGGLALIRKRR